jgi:nicotinate-nucleotide adenylyltransferase
VSATVALFGTSADPPTLGHQALLQHLLQRYPRVATWASDNPNKQHSAPLDLRARMLAALVASLTDPRLEHRQELSSPWAITTLQRAAAQWPGAQLVFVVGSDLLQQIPRWRQAAQVLQGCQLAVVPRQGWPLDPTAIAALEQLGGCITVLELPIPGTASSALRQHSDPGQMAPAAGPLVREHNLYGLGRHR